MSFWKRAKKEVKLYDGPDGADLERLAFDLFEAKKAGEIAERRYKACRARFLALRGLEIGKCRYGDIEVAVAHFISSPSFDWKAAREAMPDVDWERFKKHAQPSWRVAVKHRRSGR